MNRIKELREKKGFTSIREFTHFINDQLHYDVSVATMVLLENNKTDPQYNLVKTLANYFNVSIEYMMGE